MWADTLYAAERQYLVLLLSWAIASLIVGTTLGVTLLLRGTRSPLLRHFAAQLVLWGFAEAIVAAVRWRALHLRDTAAAARLEHSMWMNAGLDLGWVAVGATLALAGWFGARRLGPVGAAAAVMMQGLALLLLHVHVLSAFPG